MLQTFIEPTPVDSMKYEIDRVSGYLTAERSRRSSARPALERRNGKTFAS